MISELKNKNIFVKGQYTDENQLREMITSGQLKNMVTDTVTRLITAKIKEHTRTNTVNRQVKVNAPHQEPNHPHL